MAVMLSKRERVERTMAFQETDRVPLYDLLLCDAAIEHFSGERIPPLADDTATRRRVDRMTGKAIGAMLDMTRMNTFGPLVDREYVDRYGFVVREATYEKTTWFVSRPFEDEQGAARFLKQLIADVEAERRAIEADPAAMRDRFRREFLEMQARIGDTVHLLAWSGTGLDEINHRLGLTLFSYLLADDPGLISEALEAWTERNLAFCHAVADLSLSPAVLTYGDIAYKGRLLYSPDFLRQEFLPRLERLNDAWHEHGFKCLFHSDGYLMDILDDLVETGIDGLNPIETVAGMDLGEVRARYGNRLFLAGGIDMSQLLSNGTPDEVRQVCRQAIRDAYPGYFMGSTTEADNSCRLENLLVMHEVAMEGP